MRESPQPEASLDGFSQVVYIDRVLRGLALASEQAVSFLPALAPHLHSRISLEESGRWKNLPRFKSIG